MLSVSLKLHGQNVTGMFLRGKFEGCGANNLDDQGDVVFAHYS